ncbi:restriction endonuclease subunit S [Arthrobacter livingstonensis]|uniref:Restriction endonuclease subunit S n=1 Tax=Arthrobacter livingstonensis TaxID=670078 RepID=A0A2V5L3A3_9MICC|nr:restriction endonuclease subunit S [Arthrobacter livingstonensis]PYI65749.1 restriction endonuclease subunit S [Arthrobacter livingstonensis]
MSIATSRSRATRAVGNRWLAEIPENWSSTRLRFVCDVATGSGDTQDAEPDGDYDFFVRSPNPLRSTVFTFNTEAVLTAGDGAVGEIFHHVCGKFHAHQRVYVLTNFRGVMPRYFYYYFSSYFRLMAQDGSARTTVDSVRRWMLTDMPFVLPPLDEQRVIADYLDGETAQIDALVAKQQEFIGLLRERRATVITAEFDSKVKGRLRHAIKFSQTGPFGTQLSANEYVENGVPVINPSHIKRGMMEPDLAISVSCEKAAELSRHRLELGDIVLGRKGEVDKSALVTKTEVGYICGSDSMLLRPAAATVPSYLWWFFQSSAAHNQLERWSVGSTVAGLNQVTISNVTVPLPSNSEQRRIVEHLNEQTNRIDALIAKGEEHIALAKERRSALITAAVTGQFDVRTALKGT